MDGGLSMASKVEITRKYVRGYVRAAKKDKGVILGQVCEVTGWSRDNARRGLTAAGRAATRRSRHALADATIPFEVAGLDFDNGGEFINHAVIACAGSRSIYNI